MIDVSGAGRGGGGWSLLRSLISAFSIKSLLLLDAVFSNVILIMSHSRYLK